MTPAEALRAAKAKIENPENWCMGGLAKNTEGDFVAADDPTANQWCAMGALFAVGHTSWFSPSRAFLRTAARELYEAISISAQINDLPGLGHPAVMRVYDRAIELAEAAEPGT